MTISPSLLGKRTPVTRWWTDRRMDIHRQTNNFHWSCPAFSTCGEGEREKAVLLLLNHISFVPFFLLCLSVGRSVVWLATTRKSHIWTASSNFLEWPQFKVGHCYWHSSGDRVQLFAVQIRSNNFPINLCCVLESFSSLFGVPNNTSTFCCGKMLQKWIVLLVALFSFFLSFIPDVHHNSWELLQRLFSVVPPFKFEIKNVSGFTTKCTFRMIQIRNNNGHSLCDVNADDAYSNRRGRVKTNEIEMFCRPTKTLL